MTMRDAAHGGGGRSINASLWPMDSTADQRDD
jgi:hypothetical protein